MQIPVPTVRLIVTNEQDKVLILRRQNTTHGHGAWCLPGGKVKYGQTVAEAVAAELREETGLECMGMRFLFYQDSLPPEPGTMHCINLYFECTTAGTVTLGDEASESAWIAPKDLDRYTLVFGNDAALRDYWRQRATEARL
jgi:mutator protein MutT